MYTSAIKGSMVNVAQKSIWKGIHSKGPGYLLMWLDAVPDPFPTKYHDPFPEAEYLKTIFSKGDFVAYEYRQPNTGRRRYCTVIGISDDGWVQDVNTGNCLSQSFRLKDVIVWEHKKGKKGK